MNDAEVILEGDELTVALHRDLPLLRGYVHRRSGRTFGAGAPGGRLRINGADQSWDELDIAVRAGGGERRYTVTVDAGLSFDIVFALRGSTLQVRLDNIDDARTPLASLEWIDLPLLTCAASGFRCYRLFTTDPDPEAMGKMWLRDAHADIAGVAADAAPVPLIYGAIYQPRELCVFLHSNYPLFPQAHRLTPDGRYELHLGAYRHRVRSRTIAPLEAQVVFLGDLNEDGRCDLSDYRLWINRSLPCGDARYRRAIWYKILCDTTRFCPASGCVSTLAECEVIIRAFHGVTDGLPQAAFLVGVESQQPEGAYPSMDRYNENFGPRTELYRLAARCKEELNALVSYHANIDDAHRSSKDFDPALVGVRYHPGGTVFDEEKTNFDDRILGGMSHTRDVESGAIFRRFEGMMRTVPVEGTIHLDNLRITNCDPRSDPEGIGILEELVCGLMPIVDWLRERGISVSTEGYNGDRFVPLGDGVYCYSRHGCRRAWLLPPALRGRPLELYTLSAAGRGAAPEHRLQGDRLTLALAPRVPVKVIAKEGS